MRSCRDFFMVGLCVAAFTASAQAQVHQCSPGQCSNTGRSATTWVLVSGMTGGAAGFRRLEAQLLDHGQRVIAIAKFVSGIRESAGRQEWFDGPTQRSYT